MEADGEEKKHVQFEKVTKEVLNGDWCGPQMMGPTVVVSGQGQEVDEKKVGFFEATEVQTGGKMTLEVKDEVKCHFEKAPVKDILEEGGALPLPSMSTELAGYDNIYTVRTTAEETIEELKSSSWKKIMFDYAQNTSFHGLRQITEPQPFVLRRLLWLTVFLASATVLLVQMVLSVKHYISWPVAVDLKINYNKTIIFPAVTLCNENAFRTTEAYRQGYYTLIGELFGGAEPQADLGQYRTTNLSLEQLYKETAHHKADFIVSCEWESVECASNAFIPVFTDFGLCYTFNAGLRGQPLKLADSTGSEGGLKLQLNIEQYQYMHGPNEGAGLKVLVHTSDEIPLVRDHGLAIPPGSHAFIAAKTVQVRNLPPRHGKCNDSVVLEYFERYSVASCYTNCKEKFLQQKCGCRDVYMPDKHGFPKVCTLHQYQGCMLDALMEFNNVKDTCECPIPCQRLVYEPVISYASSSNFDIDALLRQSSTDELEAKYVRAQEINQKVDQSAVVQDTKLITAFVQNVKRMTSAMDKITDVLQKTEDRIDASFNSLKQRIDIHLTKALEQIKEIIDNSFVEGWEDFKETTFDMVVFDYDGLAMSLKRGIKEAERTISPSDTETRQLIYLPIESKFRRRQELLDETVEYLRIVNQSYEFAIPIKPLPGRHYDEAYLSEELMMYNEVNLVEYVYNTAQYKVRTHQMKMLMNNVNMMYNGLNVLLQVGDNYVESGEFDADAFKYGSKNLTKGSDDFHYRLFMFENRVIQVHKLLMESKITEFKLHNRTLGDAYYPVKRMIDDIKFSVLSSKDAYWKDILLIKDQSDKYLRNPNGYKTPLAKLVISKQVDESVKTIHSFFSNILLKIEDLQKGITNLHLAYEVMWASIISEPVTKKFYKAIRDDIEQLQTLRGALLSDGVVAFLQLKEATTAMADDRHVTVDDQRSARDTTTPVSDVGEQQTTTITTPRYSTAITTQHSDDEIKPLEDKPTAVAMTEDDSDQGVQYTTSRQTSTVETYTVNRSASVDHTLDKETTVQSLGEGHTTIQSTVQGYDTTGTALLSEGHTTNRTQGERHDTTTGLPETQFITTEQSVIHLATTEPSPIYQETTEASAIHLATTEPSPIYHETTEAPLATHITNEPSAIHMTTTGASPVHQDLTKASQIYQSTTKASAIHQSTTKTSTIHYLPTNASASHQDSTETSTIYLDSTGASEIYQSTTEASTTPQSTIEESATHNPTVMESVRIQTTSEAPDIETFCVTTVEIDRHTTSEAFTEDNLILTTEQMPETTMSTMAQLEEILAIFSSLLLDDFTIEELHSLDADELSARLNGDISSMNLSSVLGNLEEEFSELTERIAEMSQVAESDAQFVASFEAYRSSLHDFMDKNQINPQFYRENFMRVDIYMQELRYEEIAQQKAYDIIQLLGDIGGSMGLFIGGSLISVIELFDVFLHNGAKRCCNKT